MLRKSCGARHDVTGAHLRDRKALFDNLGVDGIGHEIMRCESAPDHLTKSLRKGTNIFRPHDLSVSIGINV
jgi:hypothetical protein